MSSAPTPAPVSSVSPHTHPGTGPHEVRFISYPKLLFIWPLILMGYLLYPFTGGAPSTGPSTAAWLYIWALILVIMAIGVDVGRNAAVFWLVLIGGVYFLGLWLRDVQGITVFGDIYKFFRGLNVQYDRSLGLALSILLTIPYLIMVGWAWVNDRWRITHNEVEHYSMGRMDDSLGRGAKTIRSEFPDVFELILGMCGTLIIFDSTGTRELRRIPHVMFLPFVRDKLAKILERTAVTETTAGDDDDAQAM